MNDTVKNLISLAESGDEEAQTELGVCYIKGDGVELDLKKAVLWWQKAADRNYAEAQYYLGLCYVNGSGIEKNNEKAKELWTKAAENGNKKAKTKLKYLIGI